MTTSFRGVIAPILTPFEDDGRIARDLYVGHARWVLDQGAHFLSPFGTTGEALSVGLAERKAALGWLVEAGIAPERLMPGTGVTASTRNRRAHPPRPRPRRGGGDGAAVVLLSPGR